MFIQPYTNINWESLMDTPALKIHMQIIRRINCEIGSITKSRINCIIQLGKDDIIISSKAGNVYTVILKCDTNCSNVHDILCLYINVLKKVSLHSSIDCDINKIKQSVSNSISLQGLNPIGYIGNIKWNKAKKIGFQIYYEISMDSIFIASIKIFNAHNNIIKTIPFFQIKCGIIIVDVIKTYIGVSKWSSENVIKIYKPAKTFFWEIDLKKELQNILIS